MGCSSSKTKREKQKRETSAAAPAPASALPPEDGMRAGANNATQPPATSNAAAAAAVEPSPSSPPLPSSLPLPLPEKRDAEEAKQAACAEMAAAAPATGEGEEEGEGQHSEGGETAESSTSISTTSQSNPQEDQRPNPSPETLPDTTVNVQHDADTASALDVPSDEKPAAGEDVSAAAAHPNAETPRPSSPGASEAAEEEGSHSSHISFEVEDDATQRMPVEPRSPLPSQPEREPPTSHRTADPEVVAAHRSVPLPLARHSSSTGPTSTASAPAMGRPSSRSASSTEASSCVPEVPMPIGTPAERVAARRTRVRNGREALTSPPAIHSTLRRGDNRVVDDGVRATKVEQARWRGGSAAAGTPPIPRRTGFTNPSSSADPQGHRIPTTYLPPPTAYMIDPATGGPRRLSLDAKKVGAIEASTKALVTAHTPGSDAGVTRGGGARDRRTSAATSATPTLASDLPPAGVDAAEYRGRPGLPPSHLCDPVYASPLSTPPAVPAGAGGAGHLSRSSVASSSLPGSQWPTPVDPAQPSRATPPASRQQQRTVAASPPAVAVGLEMPNRAERAPQTAPEEPQAHCASAPRDGSADTYELSIADVPSAKAPLAPPASRREASAATPNHLPSQNKDVTKEQLLVQQQQQQRNSSQMMPGASAPPGEPIERGYNDTDEDHLSERAVEWNRAAANGTRLPDAAERFAIRSSQEKPLHEAPSKQVESAALTEMPTKDGHVVERKELEWQLLQPPLEERRSVLNQAKFVAQMHNVTPI